MVSGDRGQQPKESHSALTRRLWKWEGKLITHAPARSDGSGRVNGLQRGARGPGPARQD